jgi:hypothetical protein
MSVSDISLGIEGGHFVKKFFVAYIAFEVVGTVAILFFGSGFISTVAPGLDRFMLDHRVQASVNHNSISAIQAYEFLKINGIGGAKPLFKKDSEK